MGFRYKGGRLTFKRKAGYSYKNCKRCGKYNGTMYKLCSSCRKYMRKKK